MQTFDAVPFWTVSNLRMCENSKIFERLYYWIINVLCWYFKDSVIFISIWSNCQTVVIPHFHNVCLIGQLSTFSCFQGEITTDMSSFHDNSWDPDKIIEGGLIESLWRDSEMQQFFKNKKVQEFKKGKKKGKTLVFLMGILLGLFKENDES